MVRIREIIEATDLEKEVLNSRGCNLFLVQNFENFKSELNLYIILGGTLDLVQLKIRLLDYIQNIDNSINEIANFQDKNYDVELETIAQSYFDLKDKINYALDQVKLGLFDWINKN